MCRTGWWLTLALTAIVAVSSSTSSNNNLPSCNLPIAGDAVLWVNNSTREVNFPLTEESCSNCGLWETSINIQSGDTLVVTINCSALPALLLGPSQTTDTPDPFSLSPSTAGQELPTSQEPSTMTEGEASTRPAVSSEWNTSSPTPFSVGIPSWTPISTPTYEVTDDAAAAASAASSTTAFSTSSGPSPPSVYLAARPAPDACDVADAVQLDATVTAASALTNGLATVTLYDKDLNEGTNFFIIVLENGNCAKLRVTVKYENCGDDGDCSGKGVCYTNASTEGYECQCCPEYIGPHCEEKDACYPSPCLNHGICVDISQGHEGSTFQCLCPFGFTGKICEDSRDPCESGPCQHGGTCTVSNETAAQFKCSCPPGYEGPVCQRNVDACASSPCHHGICVDQRDGYRCFCQPGFTGSQCEEEYNECESNPCLNGGTCLDHIDSFSCTCGRGYTGIRCQVKVDLCDPNPCNHHHYCVDKGNIFTCECPRGFTGPDCLVPTRAICSANPCRNGGTCWSSVDSFYCACRPGFTGKSCEEEVVVEVMPSSGDPMDSSDDSPIDLQVPVAIHLDHLHNVYVAAGTLACAVLIVFVTVVVCHCRMHETYKHCCFKKSPILLPCNITKLDGVLKKNNFEKDKEPLSVARPFPVLDNSDVYYTLDFSDSQSSPLIQ